LGFQDIGLKIVLLGVREFDRNAEKVEKSIGEVNRSMEKTDESSRKAARGVNRYSDSASKASKGVKDLGKDTKSLSERFTTLGANVTTLGVALTASLTVPLNLIRSQLISTGIEFEDAFSGVSKTVEGVSDEFGTLTSVGEELRAGIIKLSLRLPITANELANITAAAGQLGVKGKENLLEFTEIAAGMGVATDLASEEAAIALARLGNILGISQDDFIEWSKGTSSAVVELGNNVAATESQIINMALRIAPAASIVGLTTQEMLGLSASLAEVGVQSELGGTAVSRVFLEMAEAAGSMTAANINMKESMQDVGPALDQLRSLLSSGVTDLDELKFALRDTGLDLGGIGGMLNDLGSQGGSFDRLNSSIEKNNITLQGYQRTLTELGNDLNQLNIDLAAGTITQEEYAEKAQRIRERQAGVNDQIAKASITANDYNRSLQDLRNEVVSVDDIIRKVSQTTMMELEGAFEDSTSKIAVFADIMGVSEKAFADAFGAKPLETFQTFLTEVSRLQDEGKITADTLAKIGLSGTRVRQVLNILGPNMELMTDNIGLSNKAWIEQTALQVEVQKKFATTKGQIQLMKNALSALGIAVFDFVKPSMDALINTVTDLIKKFTEFFTASDENAEMISKLFIAASALGPALIAVGTAIRIIVIAANALNLGATFAPLIALATNPIIVAGIAAIAGTFVLIKENVFGLGDLVNQLASSLSNIFGLFTRFFTQGSIADPFKDMIGSILSGDITGAIKDFKAVWVELVWFIQNIAIPALKIEWAKIKVMVMDSVREAAQWLDSTGISLFFGFVDTVLDTIKKTAPKIFDRLKLWAEAFVDWIEPHIPKIIKTISKVVSGIIEWIIKTTPLVVGAVSQWVKGIVDWFGSGGKEQIIEGAKSLANTFFEWVSNIDIAAIIVELTRITAFVAGWLTGAVALIAAGLTELVIDVIQTTDWKKVGSDLTGLLSDMADAAVQGFFAGFRQAMGPERVDALIQDIMDWLTGSQERRLNDVLDLGRSIIEGIWEGIKLTWNKFLKPQLSAVINDLIDLAKRILGISSPSKVMMDIGRDIIRGIWDGIKFIWNTFLRWVQDRINQLVELWLSMLPRMLEFGRNVINRIWDGMRSMWGTFIAWVSQKVTEFVARWISILNQLLNFGKNVIVSIQGGIQSGWAAFITWVNTKAGEIKQKFLDIVSDMLQVGKDIVEGLKTGINESWDEFTKWIEGKIRDIPVIGSIALEILSPSQVMMRLGENIVEGLRIGMDTTFSKLFMDTNNAFSRLKTEATVSTEGISQGMLGAALGSTISNVNTVSSTSNTSNFAPTINGVPMRDERSAGEEMVRSWRMAQVTGNVL
jgi:TP901 family phage tail tape measure protein